MTLLRVFLVNFAVLALEVLMLRWVSTAISPFACFKNMVLIACFLGLGIGCATAAKDDEQTKRKVPASVTIFAFC